jgi:D-3-phosphoglycerate dehydrogenase
MKVLVSEEITEDARKLLDRFELVEKDFKSPDFEEEIKDADALVVRTYTSVCSALINKAKNLKYVIRCGVGLENVDLEYCGKNGIKVINAPGSNAESVAEHVVMVILAANRNLIGAHNHTLSGNWRNNLLGRELLGKTVGLLGFGNIGKKVAERLQGFGVKIISYEIYQDHETAKRLGVEFVDLDDLIRNSDVISVHVPLMKETHHLIDEKRISEMKDGVIIINTARGAIIDEKALLSSLKSGKVSFAALDVFENEPDIGDDLKKLDNVILTPHIAGVTDESFNRMCVQPIQKLIEEVDKA